MRVLVVDDDLGMCETLSAILEIEGAESILEQKACRPSKERGIGLGFVLMDIGMPPMDGMDACKVIKAKNPDVKIGFMTPSTADDRLREILEGDGGRIVFKPFLTLRRCLYLLQNVNLSGLVDQEYERVLYLSSSNSSSDIIGSLPF